MDSILQQEVREATTKVWSCISTTAMRGSYGWELSFILIEDKLSVQGNLWQPVLWKRQVVFCREATPIRVQIKTENVLRPSSQSNCYWFQRRRESWTKNLRSLSRHPTFFKHQSRPVTFHIAIGKASGMVRRCILLLLSQSNNCLFLTRNFVIHKLLLFFYSIEIVTIKWFPYLWRI